MNHQLIIHQIHQSPGSQGGGPSRARARCVSGGELFGAASALARLPPETAPRGPGLEHLLAAQCLGKRGNGGWKKAGKMG